MSSDSGSEGASSDSGVGDIELEERTAFIPGGDAKSNDPPPPPPYVFDAREAVKRLWPIIVVLVAYIALFATKAVLLFPFLRTLIVCDGSGGGIDGPPTGAATPAPTTAASTAADRASGAWSGSPHCGDRVLVAEHATWFRGLCEGMEHFAQCLSLPILGALVDSIGRRRVMLVGVAGLGVQFLCWAAAAKHAGPGAAAGGHAPLLFIEAGALAQGCTGGFIAAAYAMVADTTPSEGARGSDYGVVQAWKMFASGGVTVVVTALIVERNLEGYAAVWAGAAALAAALFAGIALSGNKVRDGDGRDARDGEQRQRRWWWPAFVPCPFKGSCVLRETLARDKRRAARALTWARVNPLATLAIFTESAFLQWMALFVGLFILGACSLVLLQAYTVAEYGWTQTESTFILLCAGAVSVVSLGASFWMIPRKGARAVLAFGSTAAALGVGVLALGALFHLGPAWTVAGLAGFSAGTAASPAYFALTSGRVAPDQQGRLQAGMGAVVLLCTTVGNVVYAWAFEHAGHAAPFAAGALALAGSWAVMRRVFAADADAAAASGGSGDTDGVDDEAAAAADAHA